MSHAICRYVAHQSDKQGQNVPKGYNARQKIVPKVTHRHSKKNLLTSCLGLFFDYHVPCAIAESFPCLSNHPHMGGIDRLSLVDLYLQCRLLVGFSTPRSGNRHWMIYSAWFVRWILLVVYDETLVINLYYTYRVDKVLDMVTWRNLRSLLWHFSHICTTTMTYEYSEFAKLCIHLLTISPDSVECERAISNLNTLKN